MKAQRLLRDALLGVCLAPLLLACYGLWQVGWPALQSWYGATTHMELFTHEQETWWYTLHRQHVWWALMLAWWIAAHGVALVALWRGWRRDDRRLIATLLVGVVCFVGWANGWREVFHQVGHLPAWYTPGMVSPWPNLNIYKTTQTPGFFHPGDEDVFDYFKTEDGRQYFQSGGRSN